MISLSGVIIATFKSHLNFDLKKNYYLYNFLKYFNFFLFLSFFAEMFKYFLEYHLINYFIKTWLITFPAYLLNN